MKALGFKHLVPLPLPDVLQALEEGRLEAFSGTYYSITVLQWFPFARAVVPLKWTYAFGGIVVSEKAFSRITEEEQGSVRRVMEQLTAGLSWQALQDEKNAEKGLARREGMQKVTLSPQEISLLESRARKFYPDLAADIKEEKMLQDLLGALEGLRCP